jgi:hypothetical protein
LLEIWCEEFTEDTFWRQSFQTFLASLNGRVEAHRNNAKRDMALAYHTGAFSRASKARPLSHYLGQLDKGRSKAADALSFFSAMKAKGLPVKITRVVRAKTPTAS